ncbi:transcription termination factor Rho [Leucobacter sp. W1153]|uniref:transcription termination factor Rho n=1 Tax=Leucobacter sp. W1153 TaxID=3439064 RepID=UPI003F2BF7BC
MEQISNETNAPAEVATTVAPAQITDQSASTDAAPAPARRRSRRATAATGEAVAAPAAQASTADEPAVEKRSAEKRAGEKPVADKSAAEEPLAARASNEPAAASPVADEPTAPKKRATRSRKKPVTAEPQGETSEPSGDAQPAAESASAAPTDVEAPVAPKRRATRSRKKPVEADASAAEASTNETPHTPDADPSSDSPAAEPAADSPVAEPSQDTEVETESGRGRSGNQRGQGNQNGQGNQRSRSRNGQSRRAAEAAEAENGEQQAEGSEKTGSESSPARNGEAPTRSSRTRQRERKRRGQPDDLEPEITEDDVLLPVAGILDVLDNYAFVRTSGYLPGTNDVYVSLGQVKKYGLRKGDAIVGAIRQPRDNDGAGRQKYNAIVRVDTVNSRPVEEEQNRVDFQDLTPVNPDQRLQLEMSGAELTPRVIDLFAPIGLGQRGLISGNSGSGKTQALRQIAASVAHNHPEAHLMMVLLEARPEEVTELQRSVNGEVIAATFDRPAEDQSTVAELAVERAKRLVELGHDVVVLLDSVTGLGRAHHLAGPAGARTAGGTLDPLILAPVKRLLGAARNLENGGSLTIVATANAHSTSRTDELILEELAGVWNMELRLANELAARRTFPAIDIAASGTRREELLRSESEIDVLNDVRRSVAELGVQTGVEAVLGKLQETPTNVEFLALVQRAPVRA